MPESTTSGDVTPDNDAGDKNVDTGDGPSSHETSGEFPADEVRGGPAEETDPDDTGDGPSSHETSGEFPADEVTDGGGYTTVGTTDHDNDPAPADNPPAAE